MCNIMLRVSLKIRSQHLQNTSPRREHYTSCSMRHAITVYKDVGGVPGIPVPVGHENSLYFVQELK
jgi:hypothetical protein